MDVLRAEVRLWNEARLGRVQPLVVLSRLGPITLIVGALVRALSGPLPPSPFALFSPSAAVPAFFLGLFLPTLLMAALDGPLNATSWHAFGSVKSPQNEDGSTSERERVGAFVRFPMSTYSSHGFTAFGSLILAHTFEDDDRAPLASAAVGLAFIAMGLASFGWWASRRTLLHRLDNWLMETHLMAMGVAVLTAVAPASERALVATWAGYAAYRLATFDGHGDLLWPSVVTWGGVALAIGRLGGCGHVGWFMGGVGGVHAGLVLKMYDTMGLGAWGTAAFHYATAAGWASFWAWSQTLPTPRQ
jgi:hypothetical protein